MNRKHSIERGEKEDRKVVKPNARRQNKFGKARHKERSVRAILIMTLHQLHELHALDCNYLSYVFIGFRKLGVREAPCPLHELQVPETR